MDNEEAADFAYENWSNDNTIKWVVVHPSSLIDEEDVSEYKTPLLQLEVQYSMMAKLVELMLLPL